MPMTEKVRLERIAKQQAARLVTRAARAALNAVGVRLEKRSVGKAINPSVRKQVGGKRVAYYKPLAERRKRPADKVNNVSYTVVNPESITNTCKAKCARKYRAWLRKISACRKTDGIVFTWGLSAKDRHDYNREQKRLKYMR